MLMRWIRALSLDIVAGGVAGAAFAAHVTGAALPAVFWQVLPAAIWVVYTLDHLIDGRRAGPRASNDRHAFHARHAGWLVPTVVVVGGFTTLRAALNLPFSLRLAGTLLAIAVMFYLEAVRGRFPAWLPREVAVALIYVAGIWLGPLVLATSIPPWAWMALLLHAAAALSYLFAYAWFEAAMDSADGSPSLARRLSPPRLKRLLGTWTVAATSLAMACAALAGPALRTPFAALAVIGIVPWIFVRLAPRVTPFDRYRNAEWALLLLSIPALLARLG